ncbi:hypothetical protein ID866_7996 [Astraeus odoratus]|nr:hypothetical protein ID866_7996 [Astraeus odoratus]
MKWCNIGVKDAPHSLAQPSKTSSHKNLTLFDWMTVYYFVDSHPNTPQADVIQQFSTLPLGKVKRSKRANARKDYQLLNDPWADEPESGFMSSAERVYAAFSDSNIALDNPKTLRG